MLTQFLLQYIYIASLKSGLLLDLWLTLSSVFSYSKECFSSVISNSNFLSSTSPSLWNSSQHSAYSLPLPWNEAADSEKTFLMSHTLLSCPSPLWNRGQFPAELPWQVGSFETWTVMIYFYQPLNYFSVPLSCCKSLQVFKVEGKAILFLIRTLTRTTNNLLFHW